MQIHFGLANFSPDWKHSIVCIGTFDGVHVGHCQVIGRAVALSRQEGVPCCLLTFDRHPAATLKPQFCPPGILSLEGRLSRFQDLGVAVTVVLPFDLQFSETSASDFLEFVLIDRFKAKRAVVGHDFAMGKNRSGDSEWLRSKFPTEIVPPFELFGKRVSSSLVRSAIQSGNVEDAEAMLGYPFEISGIVVPGDKLGRRLGFPTANVARSFCQVDPPDGVYAGAFTIRGATYASAVSIGVRPTVAGLDRRIEAYCLDYSGSEFYGEFGRLNLFRWLHPQKAYESLEVLRENIERDVAEVRSITHSRRQNASIAS